MSGYDVVVVGSGVAGLSTALGLAGSRRVALITAGRLGGGSTAWAQGGIAAALDPSDSPRLHAIDTAVAGVEICDEDMLRCLTEEAPGRLAELLGLGAEFDRDDAGHLELTREGGHQRRRVAHAGGDATGAEVSRALVAAARLADIDVIGSTTVVDVVRAVGPLGPQVCGVRVRPAHDTAAGVTTISARAVVLATGGIGGVYDASTNPPEITGDGLAIALRAGASLVDLEFVQFHPTALRLGSGVGQIPLITEALRGEGAILRDADGVAIMPGYHPMADLAPRDVVARRIVEVMTTYGDAESGQVFLDATGFGPGVLEARFPTVYASCRRGGIDPTTEPIPIIPAQHFLCGGIRTDRWGATDVRGLFAAGEVAATGLHGANRLASNSLIEGMVIGRRLAEQLSHDLPPLAVAGELDPTPLPHVSDESIAEIRATMTRHAAVRRSASGLATAAKTLTALVEPADTTTPPSLDAANRWTVAAAIIAAADAREESRGCHWREDHPASDDGWLRHVIVRLDDDGMPAARLDHLIGRTA